MSLRRSVEMFDNNVKTEAIPERVLELCKLLVEKSIKEGTLKEYMEPEVLQKTGTVYFPIVRDAAIELRLIRKNGDLLEFCGDKAIVKNLDTFRLYCNSVLWKDNTVFFFKIAQTILNFNVELVGENLTSSESLRRIRDVVSPSVNETMLLGERFWLSFLGFGYVHELQKIVFLPNMYVAMKDFITIGNYEKGKEYTIKEFILKMSEYAKIAFEGTYESKCLNLASSNALRLLDRRGEIELSRHSDSKEVWRLYELETQNMTEITHITVRGMRK